MSRMSTFLEKIILSGRKMATVLSRKGEGVSGGDRDETEGGFGVTGLRASQQCFPSGSA